MTRNIEETVFSAVTCLYALWKVSISELNSEIQDAEARLTFDKLNYRFEERFNFSTNDMINDFCKEGSGIEDINRWTDKILNEQKSN